MNDLRVLFNVAADQSYRAQLADAKGRRLGVEVPFMPFLAEDDYEDLRWYLEEYMDLPDGGAVVRARRIEGDLTRWGHTLYEALFGAEENRTLLSQLLAGPEPRELTIATRDPALLRLPWELMADDAGSLAQRLSVRRQLEEPEETTPRPAMLPLRILYVVSRPADAGFIDPRLTAKALFDALDPLGSNVCIDFCRPPTVGRMEEMLREGQRTGDPYDIVHFDGHGTFLPEEQIGVLCFEEPDNGLGASATDFVAADRLGEMLTSYTVPLVILEACRSATLGETAVSGSVAPRLIQAGVGSVLAMSHAVHVEATRLLLEGFYRGLVRGTTIGQAMAEAREVLRSTAVRWIESGPVGRTIELRDWFLPHLYQSAADEALVPSSGNADAEDARRRGFRSPATRDESGSFPPPPQFGFRGRARELHELERQFRAGRGIVLHAMGGMGKTALATEAAHWWTRSGLFRDGACFLSFEQFASADRAVQVLGTYLEGPKFEQLPAAEQRRRVIELFQQNAVLMVWDNFESALPQFNDGAAGHGNPYTDDERHRLAELFRDLTAGPGKGCLLVTCRPGETGLPGAQRYELQGLARADSLWLLSSILRRDGLTLSDPRLSRDKLDPLLRDLADHPLSLELVGPHLRTLTPEAIRADFGKLLAKFQQEAPEERNQSLLASLEFSRRHLSPAAREALPWLGLFSGGVFEDNLLDVSQLAPEAWEPIRGELQGIALVRAEGPFLRFHPTLAVAAADPTLAQNLEIRKRFIGVYLSLRQTLDGALRGSQPRAALEVLNREEANYRTAVQWAVADQQFRTAAELGDTFREYLQRSGRLRERDAWVQWLKDTVGQHGFTEEAAIYERQHAWTRFTQGDPQGAVDQLQALIERLRQTTEFDPAFQSARTTIILGRVLDHAGASAQAIPILRQAIGQWEALVEKAGGQTWEKVLASPDHAKAGDELGNLAVTMGDLANALSSAGQYEEALAVAEEGLRIDERTGNQREVAAGKGRSASILMAAGRYDEADGRYDLALAAARQAGDRELEGAFLQHQGALARQRNQLDRAARLFQQALQHFWEDHQGVMQTYSLLGGTELKAGRLAEARAWYEKSRERAVQLKDQPGIGNAAQNIGIVWQEEGEAARDRGDEPGARRHFEEARRSVEESLRVWQSEKNKPKEAAAWSQFATIHLGLGDLAAAERYAHEARQIRESLGLKEAWKDYNTLSEIAQARGDTTAAAEWAKKRDELRAELKRRAGGDGGLPAQMLKVLQALTLACAQAGFGDSGLGPAEEEALAQLDELPAPFPDFAAFLRQIAAGQLPPIPGGLPGELREWLGELVEAIQKGS
jgi:tetratricopeptide (TPR) repeat protein